MERSRANGNRSEGCTTRAISGYMRLYAARKANGRVLSGLVKWRHVLHVLLCTMVHKLLGKIPESHHRSTLHPDHRSSRQPWI
eukprot:2987043-Pyramimonas_sp.AAC.1